MAEARLGSVVPNSLKGCAVPVPAVTVAETETPLKQTSGTAVVNPFTLLGSDKWAGRPRSRKEVNPAPLKRARPVEELAPRVVSNGLKGKGKVSGKKAVHSSFTFPASTVDLNGPVPILGSGPESNRALEGSVSAGPADIPHPMQEESRSHDSVVTLLKKAIQSKATVEVMDRLDQRPFEGVISGSCPPDAEMSGEVEGPPPLLNENPYMEC